MRELEREAPEALGASADPITLPPLAIVGAGRVGRSLALAAERAGLAARLAGRNDALDACRASEVALLCVPDAAIEEACEGIVDAIPPLRLVGHTSGVSDLESLASAAERGADTFSIHPLQTVPDGDADLTGTPCAVSGSSPAARGLAGAYAEQLGMEPFAVPDEARVAYHAAAVIASNFLVALKESAADLLERSGIEGGRDLLTPLVLRTAANWAERGDGALTGPIARGDDQTVELHLAALREHAPELVPLYEVLAERTRALAARRRDGDPAAASTHTDDPDPEAGG
jgi:predicted short-subunit dehydrogenase-like oxidoreductase (DUF2520 family)